MVLIPRQESVFKGNWKICKEQFYSQCWNRAYKESLDQDHLTTIGVHKNTLLDGNRAVQLLLVALNNSRPFANYDYTGPDGNYGASTFGDAVGCKWL